MFIIGFILANRCSVKRLKVKVKKMMGKFTYHKKCYESSFVYTSILSAGVLSWLLQERASY